jgi:hypothetical protein
MRLDSLRFKTSQNFAFLFWFLACFPGKLGYDYALLTKMVQNEQSTAWWGSIYFWIFRWFTFGGSQIFFLALIGLLSLTFAIRFFIESLPIQSNLKTKTLTFVMLTPLYGVFGMTISHDVFQTSGMLILSGIVFRILNGTVLNQKQLILASLFASVSLMTTQTGIVIVVVYSVFLFFRYAKLSSLILTFLSLIIYLASNIGIVTNQTTSSFVQSTLPRLMLIDIKCIVQHPEAEISDNDWMTLTRYAEKSQWLIPTNCSNPDDLAAPLELDLLQTTQLRIDRDLIETFFRLVAKHPAIPVISHIQRSRMALPPPFFQPPTNQIPWNVEIPLGFNTNVALQSGPGLLHPSVDESTVDINFKYLIPFEVIAQLLTLFINQASWFWGWGGLWLWPIIGFTVLRLKIKNVRGVALALFPTLTLHFVLFCIGPSSLGRYVMSTVLQGFILSYVLVVEKVKSL